MDLKTILATIQTDLKNSTTLSYVSDTNIFITPDEDIIPVGTTFPAIGLKDGPERYERDPVQMPADRWDMAAFIIQAIIYVELSAGATPVIGQTTPTVIKGILDICTDVDAVLESKYSAIAGVEDFRILDSGASEIVGSRDLVWLKKTRLYEYSVVKP